MRSVFLPGWWRWGLAGVVTAIAVVAGAWLLRPTTPHCPIQLREVTARTGITFRHTDGGSGKKYIVEYVSAGLATFDYDNDGLIDIYFVNGAPLRGTQVDVPPSNALYRNLGGFRFQDCTAEAGVGDLGHGLGVTVGDYDNDGFQDLYVSNFGPKVLYHNNGDGTFTEVTQLAGVADGNQVGAGVAFLDMDGDGDLDLYVANYVDFHYETYQPRVVEGLHVYPSPLEFAPLPHTLYRNNGDGTFTDVTQESIVGEIRGTGMGMICADVDNDGDTDILVLNDVFRNFFFENDGTGKFREQALLVGLAYNGEGHSLGSMGVDCGDYDNDGWLDFFQTSYASELPVLYRNLGRGLFEDVTVPAQAGATALPHVKWGVGFGDFDNDGNLDLFFANGHLQDNIERYDSSAFYLATNTVLKNQGDGTFADVSQHCGDGLAPRHSGRGTAVDDLDNDGKLDIVVLNSRCAPTMIRNESRTGHHWIEILLHGVHSNRDGVGAHVSVTTAAGPRQLREVHSGRGYQSHSGTRLHFGLGSSDRLERLEVRWIGGGTTVLTNVTVDRCISLIEGGDVAVTGAVSARQRTGGDCGIMTRGVRALIVRLPTAR